MSVYEVCCFALFMAFKKNFVVNQVLQVDMDTWKSQTTFNVFYLRSDIHKSQDTSMGSVMVAWPSCIGHERHNILFVYERFVLLEGHCRA